MESDSTGWSTAIVAAAHEAVFTALGEHVAGWEGAVGSDREREKVAAARRRGDVGEGGMYI